MNRKSNLLIPLLLSGTAIAQSTGTFTPTGSMISPRANHTATLLHNGKVLVAGGSFVGNGKLMASVLSGAELYDPGTGTFAETGNMSSARAGHTATLLANGQVLITGGIVDHPPSIASAELYDPSIGTFTPTGSMTIGRVGHTATLLRNGQVLITGGDNGGSPFRNSAEIYDPSTGTFSATGSMNMFRVGHTATLLSNGKVLVDGGEGGAASAEIYDPATGTFSQTGGTTYYPSYLSSGSSSLLPDGKVLLTLYSHRDEDLDPTNLAELYDPSSATFLATGNMTAYRNLPTATLLPDGTVLIAGLNYYAVGAAISHAELYDPAAGTFSATGNMRAGRLGHTATLLLDGTVLFAGGAERDGNTNATTSWLATAELYHPATLIPAPVLYSLSGDGRGQGAIWHGDTGQLASADNPATSGQALSMYTTSLGDGSVIPPQVAIGGRLADVLFFGNAPGYPGFNQVNVRVPGGITAGSAIPVRLIYLGRSSNEVTIALQ